MIAAVDIDKTDVDKVTQDLISKISQKINKLKTLNIIVAGKTGVGKSTLINAVFREKLTETGMGKPVTDHMRKITKKGIPLSIYDTRGFELGKDVQTEVKKEILDTIGKGLAMKNINDAIHCIWYCINAFSDRAEDQEIEWIRELSKENQIIQVPIIIVITKSLSKNQAECLRNKLLDENLNVIQVIPVLAEDYMLDDGYVAKSFGLDTLVKVMAEALPDELLDTLHNVQIASLSEKKRYAQTVVATATTLAIGEGAAPIPFSDVALLIPTQLSMIASITVIFGFDVSKSVLTAFLSSAIGSGGATLLGKTVVTNLTKLIPGPGTVIGGAISATTAGVITAALGEAYIGIMELVFKGEMSIGDLNTKAGKEQMTAMFKSELKKKR